MAHNAIAGHGEEDFAAAHGLTQCFPVVAPLSSIKLGPQDIRPPDEAWSVLCADEREDDSWAFRRDRAKAELAREAQIASGLRHQAEQAEREADAAAKAAEQRKAAIEASVDKRHGWGEEELLALKTRLAEAKKILLEVQSECTQKVDEGQMLLGLERQHTSEVRDLLAKKIKKTEALKEKVEEVELQSQHRMEARQREVDAAAAKAQRLVSEAQHAAEERIESARRRYEAEVKLMRERLAGMQVQCAEREELEAKRKDRAREAASERRSMAAARLETDKACAAHCEAQVKADCERITRRLQEREARTARVVQSRLEKPSEILGLAAAKSLEVHRREVVASSSLGFSAHVLGHPPASARRLYELAGQQPTGQQPKATSSYLIKDLPVPRPELLLAVPDAP